MSKSTKILILVILLYLPIPITQWIFELNETEKLKHTITCVSVLRNVHFNDAVGGSAYGIFEYKVKGKFFRTEEIGDFSFLQIGDSVLIKYAVNDPSVARVLDKYYMQKYKHLKKR